MSSLHVHFAEIADEIPQDIDYYDLFTRETHHEDFPAEDLSFTPINYYEIYQSRFMQHEGRENLHPDQIAMLDNLGVVLQNDGVYHPITVTQVHPRSSVPKQVRELPAPPRRNHLADPLMALEASPAPTFTIFDPSSTATRPIERPVRYIRGHSNLFEAAVASGTVNVRPAPSARTINTTVVNSGEPDSTATSLLSMVSLNSRRRIL
ncbi:hypothetical protein BON22_5206 [Cyberlindnera fabianii]|uniref:Uncharacterized protein n=1 Tax=Cyberlindnera fabianii TaxID=36022 RepID=A0A1V2L117_CYBFA|nr:hypothetical protein BON22_5206 [Cyberlindnera fabianii]